MPKQSYIIEDKDRITITRQEGDTGSIELTFPTFLELTGNHLYFQIWDCTDKVIFSCDETDMTIVDQTVWIPLEEDDTAGYSGEYSWEIQWINDSTVENVTAGAGNFIVNKEGPR